MAQPVYLYPCLGEGKEKPVGSSEKERLKRSPQSALISHWEREKEVRGLSLLLKGSTWQAESWLICTPTPLSTEIGPTQAHLTLAHSPPHTGGGLYIYHRLRYDPLLWKRELAIGKEGERKEGGGREGRQT